MTPVQKRCRPPAVVGSMADPRPARSALRLPGRAGFTLIEILVVALVLATVLYACLKLWNALGRGVEDNTRNAGYYHAAGILLDQLNMDLKSAVEVHKQKRRLELMIPEGKDSFATVKVVYTLGPDERSVVRDCNGKISRYEFGAPPTRGDGFLFEIE